MNWFEAITGFRETSYHETQRRLRVVDGHLCSDANLHSYSVGVLETPSLAELRARTTGLFQSAQTSVSIIHGDVRQLHAEPRHAGAVFQVASQFNLLEMVGPNVAPEDGVARYELDRTQGPACAIAAGAGTIFRNYLIGFEDGHRGQIGDRQVDCLRDLGEALGNQTGSLWKMKNGYALFTHRGLSKVDAWLAAASNSETDRLRSLLRVGLHWDVGLTDVQPGPTVSQVFCSALPVSYNQLGDDRLWNRFATLILEAAYEATLRAGWLNAARGGSSLVFLTRLGGGAFGNSTHWIDGAIRRALRQSRTWGLDVRLVSYGPPDAELIALARAESSRDGA